MSGILLWSRASHVTRLSEPFMAETRLIVNKWTAPMSSALRRGWPAQMLSAETDSLSHLECANGWKEMFSELPQERGQALGLSRDLLSLRRVAEA